MEGIARKILRSAAQALPESITACHDCKPVRPFECIWHNGKCEVCGESKTVRTVERN